MIFLLHYRSIVDIVTSTIDLFTDSVAIQKFTISNCQGNVSVQEDWFSFISFSSNTCLQILNTYKFTFCDLDKDEVRVN